MKHLVVIVVVFLSSCFLPEPLFGQGSLAPPGAPGPTMKTLDQVEARTPVDATHTPGNSTNQFIISTSGSYYLTGNITGVSGKNGISINADNVMLDLNGFAVIGMPDSIAGILVSGSHRHIAVHGGTVRSWPGDGVNLGTTVVTAVYSLLVSNNGGIGISAGDTGTLRDCAARENGGDNIQAVGQFSVARCEAISSTFGYGFNLTGGHSTISGCTANFNKLDGIKTSQGSRVSDCTANNNSQSGINMPFGGQVEHCVADSNAVYGIVSDAGAPVDILYNFCLNNKTPSTGAGGAGIRVGGGDQGGSRIEGNNLRGNFVGISVASPRNIIIRNAASLNFGGYSIQPGNSFGPIVNVTGVGDITSTANANHPAANFLIN